MVQIKIPENGERSIIRLRTASTSSNPNSDVSSQAPQGLETSIAVSHFHPDFHLEPTLLVQGGPPQTASFVCALLVHHPSAFLMAPYFLVERTEGEGMCPDASSGLLLTFRKRRWPQIIRWTVEPRATQSNRLVTKKTPTSPLMRPSAKWGFFVEVRMGKNAEEFISGTTGL